MGFMQYHQYQITFSEFTSTVFITLYLLFCRVSSGEVYKEKKITSAYLVVNVESVLDEEMRVLVADGRSAWQSARPKQVGTIVTS